ncbi:MAG: hypothetical protein JWQ72_1609 [Polaromonas sp.]|nr:hypothetical protein [Polaromonas sp.]
MKKAIIGALLAAAAFGAAADPKKQCNLVTCDSGTKVRTVASDRDPYYGCATAPMANYTNFVIGLVSLTIQMTGKLPNISPTTGEPEYKDGPSGPNQSRLMVEGLRRAAGVEGMGEATRKCVKGVSGRALMVLNNPDDGVLFFVSDPQGQGYWMPRSHAEKR